MRAAARQLALLFPAAALMAVAQVQITQESGKIRVDIDGKPFTEFFTAANGDVPKPFLHPLRSASGKIVTRRWPQEQNTGEETDHPHHRGVFVGHDHVNGVNFWANEPKGRADNLGIFTLKEVSQAKGGKRSGVVVASFDWKDPKGKVILTEKRTMTFYAGGPERIVDFDFLFLPNGKVTIGDSKEGFFAVRVAKGLQELKSVGRMVSNTGAETEKNIWGKPFNWVDFQGEIDGEKLGLAIFDHPDNLRHPQRWHARAYGLFAVNPFGLSVFTGDKTQSAEYVIEPDKTLRLRYRIVIHPGDAQSGKVAELYEKYVSTRK